MHDEALTLQAKVLFARLAQFKNFYLAGGTALALQIGHRLSIDFDLFSFQALPQRLLAQVKRVFTGLKIIVTYRSAEQLNLLINDIKFTFFFFEYPLVNSLIRYQKIPICSIPELAAMKAFAIGNRLSYKDYVDWYFLLKEGHVKIDEVIRIAKKKFGGDFNDRLFLGQLVSLEDVPTQKIDFLKEQVDRETIQNYLERTVCNYRI